MGWRWGRRRSAPVSPLWGWWDAFKVPAIGITEGGDAVRLAGPPILSAGSGSGKAGFSIADPGHDEYTCSICIGSKPPTPGELGRRDAERLLAAIDALPPKEYPTIVLSVTGPGGMALDLQVSTDLASARELVDQALGDLIRNQ